MSDHTPLENQNETKKGQNPAQNLSNHDAIAIYTVLKILLKMQKTLGLEAMLEYIAKYLEAIDKNNPQIKYAVSQATSLINIEKIYKEAVCNENQ